MFIFLITRTSRGISAELHVSQYCHWGLFHRLCSTFHLSLLNLIKFLLDQSSSPLRCLHIVALLSSVSLLPIWRFLQAWWGRMQSCHSDHLQKFWIVLHPVLIPLWGKSFSKNVVFFTAWEKRKQKLFILIEQCPTQNPGP